LKLFVKITTGSFHNASRDKRELAVVQNLGLETLVVAKGESTVIKGIDGWIVHALSTRPIGRVPILTKINRILSLFTWAYYIRSLKANYLSCHDLYALFIGWLSTLGLRKDKKPLLIYDSHEFEAGISTDGQRGKIKSLLILSLERFLILKTALNIMVNDTIADEVQKLHQLPVRPLVVRNIPSYWNINLRDCEDQRRIFCDQLNVPVNTFLIMYHGGMMKGRGIEHILEASSKIKNIAVILLGDGDTHYLSDLRSKSKLQKIDHFTLFHPAVSQSELWRYIGAVDLGIIPIQNVCLSYYYSLPNKLFENIQALTPIISSNFPEMSKIVNSYKIGICINPKNTAELSEAIKQVKDNPTLYKEFKHNLTMAKIELCWEQEKNVLIDAYNKLIFT